MNPYYDRNGSPTDITGWSSAFEGDRHIGRTTVRDRANPDRSFYISTVWLGLDHSFGSGPPRIFETMAFPEGEWAEEFCERYATEEQAREGHAAAVAQFTAQMDDPIVTEGEPG